MKDVKKLVEEASLEIFPEKDLLAKIDLIRKGTTLAVTCTSKLGIQYTIDQTLALREKGYDAYPHLPARLMKDKKEIQQTVHTLLQNNINHIFVAAGNPPEPSGPYGSAMDLLLEIEDDKFPFAHAAVAGYPEGHPQISQELLMEALLEKQAFAKKHNIDMRIITQFCFDADTIVEWAMRMNNLGITLPISIGIPGPCNGVKLLQFALKCGVKNSLHFLEEKKNVGQNLARHIVEYHPDSLLQGIIEHKNISDTNIIGFHFYTFNNLSGFAKWQKKFLSSFSVAKA